MWDGRDGATPRDGAMIEGISRTRARDIDRLGWACSVGGIAETMDGNWGSVAIGVELAVVASDV